MKNFISDASLCIPQLLAPSGWTEHAPFAFWLAQTHKPQTFVELGTYRGYSYFAFNQALKALETKTRCFAVDTWKGDEHAGFYEDDVFEEVCAYNDRWYWNFSELIRTTFDEAVERFSEGSIDLLHIDGRHFYADVKHDYENWKPKLSRRAVVLFHDTNVRVKDFGVFQLWNELRTQYPHFEFLHGHGLGVLGVGPELGVSVSEFLAASEDENLRREIQAVYCRLGQSISDRVEMQRLSTELLRDSPERTRLEEENRRLSDEVQRIQEENRRLLDEIQRLQERRIQVEEENRRLSDEVQRVQGRGIQVEEENRRLSDEVQRIQEENRRLSDEVQRVQERRIQVEEEYRKLSDEVQRVQGRGIQVEDENRKLSDEIQRLQEHSIQVEEENRKLSAEVQRLQEELEIAGKHSELHASRQAAAELTERINVLNDRIAALKTQELQNRELLMDRFGHQVEALTSELRLAQSERDRSRGQLCAFRSEIERLHQDFDRLAVFEREYMLAMSSRSWNVTRPLRAGTRLLQKLKRSVA